MPTRRPRRVLRSISGPRELSLPLPEGGFSRFQINNFQLMGPGLAARFPELKTYSGVGVDNPLAIAQIDFTGMKDAESWEVTPSLDAVQQVMTEVGLRRGHDNRPHLAIVERGQQLGSQDGPVVHQRWPPPCTTSTPQSRRRLPISRWPRRAVRCGSPSRAARRAGIRQAASRILIASPNRNGPLIFSI